MLGEGGDWDQRLLSSSSKGATFPGDGRWLCWLEGGGAFRVVVASFPGWYSAVTRGNINVCKTTGGGCRSPVRCRQGGRRFGAPSIADPPPSSRASASSPCLRWANTLYVGTHGGHFAVYNVTNPGAAVLVGMVDVSDPVWDIALIGTNAVVALGRAGIGLVDVSVPIPSVLIPGSGITSDWATRVRTVGNRVYSNRGTALRVRRPHRSPDLRQCRHGRCRRLGHGHCRRWRPLRGGD